MDVGNSLNPAIDIGQPREGYGDGNGEHGREPLFHVMMNS